MPACSRRSFILGVSATVLPLPARSEATAAPRIIEARPAKAQLLAAPAPPSDILGFDGTTPGPLLRYKQGDALFARLVNKTDLPLTLHWQGMRGENAMDGAAPLTQAAVAPGASFDYRRPLPEPGLFCYRPSVYPRSGELLGRGLKGLLIVDEPSPLESDADIVVALDDWKLDSAGAVDKDFSKDSGTGEGQIGAALTVNGSPSLATHEAAPGARVRLRLANLANARIMILSFEGVKPYVVAVDSQPCDAFVPVRDSIPVAPGARFELLFDLPAEPAGKARLILRGADGQDKDLMRFAAKGEKLPPRPPIRSLPDNPALPREIKLQQSKKVDLVIAPDGAGWRLNGAPSGGYSGDPLFRVKRGAPVTLGFDNRARVPLVMHVHGHAVRLLHDLDDGWEPYWRNAVVAPPGKTKHVAFIADSPGKWALHDDILDHEAAGLATWFEVT
ncbi:multicopper oxidase family protein [Methylocystis heyeri]|uniref:Multicopper oxidase domain-containing protein n=1 Tax=Methylocystis heyeri TaxID=391905 RepID=A0A6B8KGG3_9HYPH|nr:multicopper oxidase family protein [Methylocystis heyeri]QGM45563.1 multicopper oxidase domain-containing protein [Methylocystis heyeri]